ncbi:MAG: PEP-CTERM sorting domain-containing protein [Pirellulales bacterium]|nr:PEP-CTERM sorting domain-containing protein [Pirellulales bacterium]
MNTSDASWTDIGTLNYGAAGGPFYSQPSIRHRYSFDPVQATGIRLIVPGCETSGSQAGTCIEEIEVYGTVPEPSVVAMLLAVLISAVFLCRRGD